MGPLNQLKINELQAWTSQVLPNVPGSSQDRPRVTQDGKVEAPSMPNDIRGHQNLPKICENPSLDLKDSFVMLPSVPKSAQGPPRRQSEATNHAK